MNNTKWTRCGETETNYTVLRLIGLVMQIIAESFIINLILIAIYLFNLFSS